MGSGLLTYQVYYWVAKSGSEDSQTLRQLLTGIPFGVACSLRFFGVRKWIAPAVFLDCVTWVVAFRLGLALSPSLNPFFAMAVAGLVGAVGVSASTGLGCRALYTRQALASAALVGAIAGVPFGLALNSSAQENLILAISFPLWQVAVGMWLWVSLEHARGPEARKL